MLKKLLEIGDAYAKESTWKDFAVLKICLASLGLMAGTLIPEKKKKNTFIGAICVYMVTYVPLMIKTFRIAAKVLSKENGEN